MKEKINYNTSEALETWTQLIINSKLTGKYYLSGIRDDLNALNLFLRRADDLQEIKLIYTTMWGYSNLCEQLRGTLIQSLTKRYGVDFHTKHSFFKIENSQYLKWLAVQSRGFSRDLPLQHFVIMGVDYIVDVIAQDYPQVQILNFGLDS